MLQSSHHPASGYCFTVYFDSSEGRTFKAEPLYDYAAYAAQYANKLPMSVLVFAPT